jgi:hypothetical protein
MKLFLIIKNWFILTYYKRIINKYDNKRPLIVKKLLKRKLQIVKVKLNCKLSSLIIVSHTTTPYTITHIDFLWINPTLYPLPTEEINVASAMYQGIYELFMQWQHLFVPTTENAFYSKVTLVLDITNQHYTEQFRRILTLYGFYPDTDLTLFDLDFKKPWREKETLNNIVYSRLLS